MRTEEQEWEELEKKLNPETVDCRTGVCRYKVRLIDVWSRMKMCVHKMFSKTRKKS